MDLQQLHRRRAVPLPPPARRAAPPRRRSSAPLAEGGRAPPTGSGSERQSKLGIESRLKEGRGARLEGGRGGGARRRWRAGLDPAWIHREGRGAAGRICREEREGNVRGGMGKGKAAGHIKEMEIDRELLILRSTVNSASRSLSPTPPPRLHLSLPPSLSLSLHNAPAIDAVAHELPLDLNKPPANPHLSHQIWSETVKNSNTVLRIVH